MPDRVIFFTGFPGFIGGKIVESIILKDPKVKVIALIIKPVEQQANTIIKAKKFQNNIELVIGDVTKPNLGLEEHVLNKLCSQITDIFHLAAIYDMEVPKRLAWNVNVRGTNNMLKFALKCKILNVFVFFSSTVAAGIIKGHVHEDVLDTKRKFHFNHYEQTKFASEMLVRRHMDQLPIIIIRPGAVVGDSNTGETIKFDGFYVAFKFIPILKLFPIWMANSTFRVPMVPVDYIVDATIHAAEHKDCYGHCFQLGEFDLTANQFLAYICDKDETGTKMVIPKKLFETFINLPFFSYIFTLKPVKRIMRKYIMPAEMMEAMDSYNYCYYRTDNAKKYLEPAGIKCPEFKQYAKNIVAFYNEKKDIISS